MPRLTFESKFCSSIFVHLGCALSIMFGQCRILVSRYFKTINVSVHLDYYDLFICKYLFTLLWTIWNFKKKIYVGFILKFVIQYLKYQELGWLVWVVDSIPIPPRLNYCVSNKYQEHVRVKKVNYVKDLTKSITNNNYFYYYTKFATTTKPKSNKNTS